MLKGTILVSAHQLLETNALKEHWKNIGADGHHGYESYVSRPEAFYEAVFSDVLALIERSASILEIGCSVGGNLDYLYRNGFKNLTGVDINDGAVAHGMTVFDHLRGRLHASDAIEFISARNRNEFDLIFTVGCLQNVPQEDREIFAEIARCSAGFVFFKEPDLIGKDLGQIASVWDYRALMCDHNFDLILEKVLPNNRFGGSIGKELDRVPVLRLFRQQVDAQ